MQLVSAFGSLSSYVNNGLCTFRRMLILVAMVIGLSILTLLVQYYLTRDGSSVTYTSIKRFTAITTAVSGSDPNISAEHCWLREGFDVVAECVPCSEFEKAAGIRPCRPSGYYDKINCTQSGIVYRSCQRVRWLDERKFIAFFVSTNICAITFTFLAYWRQRILDRMMIEKLQKQLCDGM